jgi:hypothetical protein
MKNTIILLIALMCFMTAGAQNKVSTKTGVTTFEASVPSFEEVKATNKNSVCALNTATGDIASLILVKGFKFRLAMMEEHFNENYIESDKYPKATFKGKIDDFDINKLTPQKQDFSIKGKMELHGKTKDIVVVAKISKDENGIINIVSNFTLNTDDFDIDLPFLISNKVSKKVMVSLNFNLQ